MKKSYYIIGLVIILILTAILFFWPKNTANNIPKQNIPSTTEPPGPPPVQ